MQAKPMPYDWQLPMAQLAGKTAQGIASNRPGSRAIIQHLLEDVGIARADTACGAGNGTHPSGWGPGLCRARQAARHHRPGMSDKSRAIVYLRASQ
jgi:hypothetical protein